MVILIRLDPEEYVESRVWCPAGHYQQVNGQRKNVERVTQEIQECGCGRNGTCLRNKAAN